MKRHPIYRMRLAGMLAIAAALAACAGCRTIYQKTETEETVIHQEPVVGTDQEMEE